MCKRVLSRGSERTLAGRTRGCRGLIQEEIQEVGGPEEKSESQYRDWRRDEISLEKLWCMKEGLIKEVVGEKQGRWFTVLSLSAQQSEGSIVKTVIITVFTLTTKLTQWLTMVHVTAQWIHLFTQPDNCANRYWLCGASAPCSGQTAAHPPEH